MTVKIVPNDKGNPPGKLAEAELHFTEGPLEGLKLIGFAVWERKAGNGRNVTFPARQYSVNGERRSFALLRPIVDVSAQDHPALVEHDPQTRLNPHGGISFLLPRRPTVTSVNSAPPRLKPQLTAVTRLDVDSGPCRRLPDAPRAPDRGCLQRRSSVRAPHSSTVPWSASRSPRCRPTWPRPSARRSGSSTLTCFCSAR